MEGKQIRKKKIHELPQVGTQLQGKTKAEQFYATVVANPSSKTGVGILFKGKAYSSMTAAAVAATGRSINGWLFWKEI